MILILDACTISNLLHVVQDDSLIKILSKSFTGVYIAKEVISEVDANKYAYLSYYDSMDTVKQLIADIKLENYISEFDSDKRECIPFIRKFSIKKGLNVKEDDGEFHSTLLSLYISRWGETNLFENNNKVLFATDDSRARDLYKNIFSTNQVGIIIDSIDILTILHLKGHLTKKNLLRNIEGIMALYKFSLNELKVEITKIKVRELNSPDYQLHLTTLMELVLNVEIEKISGTIHENGYKKLYKSYSKLKDLIKGLPETKIEGKIAYLTGRHEEINSDLLWII